MASSLAVANRFLDLARERGDPLTPMQLLKLVYIAHGWMLGIHGKPLIHDRIEAWQYGPVIRSLYAHVRNYRGDPITKKLPSLMHDSGLNDEERGITDQVFEAYSKFSGLQLSRMTHADGTPWALTYEPGSFGKVIPTDIIEDHYQRLAARVPG